MISLTFFHDQSLVVFLLLLGNAAATLSPHLAATFPLKHIAVTEVAPKWPGSEGPALLTTTFSAFGKEPVGYVPNLATIAMGEAASVKTLEEETKWTNFIGMAPKEIGPNIVVTAGGFLVPGHQTGTIDLWDATNPGSPIHHQVSTDKSGWFYHKIVWHDMDQDGKLDIVAARATVPMTGGKPQGELIWLRQPDQNATSASWEETTVVSGPDVDFIMVDLNGDSKYEVVAAQFFSKPILAAYACSEAAWSLCNASNVEVTVIDDEKGPFFTVESADLNNDGTDDLLVSNNEADGTGALFAFEVPKSKGVRGSFVRHQLASGFKPYPSVIPSPGAHSRGSPGAAHAFHIETSKAGKEKPQILLSGDDGGFVSILYPTSAAEGDWTYSMIYVCNSTGTMGGPSYADVDGDGLTELFVPFYSAGKIEVYNFSTASPAPVDPKCVACLEKKDPVHLSASSSWCYKDSSCHIVGSPFNPCKEPSTCTSAASVSKCGCTSCNDAACK